MSVSLLVSTCCTVTVLVLGWAAIESSPISADGHKGQLRINAGPDRTYSGGPDFSLQSGIAAFWSFDLEDGVPVRDVTGAGPRLELKEGATLYPGGRLSASSPDVDPNATAPTDGEGTLDSAFDHEDPGSLDFTAAQAYAAFEPITIESGTVALWYRKSAETTGPGHDVILVGSESVHLGRRSRNRDWGGHWCNRWWSVVPNEPAGNDQGVWHHAAFTFDGSLTRFYLDGELLGEVETEACEKTLTWLGLETIQGNRFNGYLDAVQIFDRPLTTGEVSQLSRADLPVGYIAGGSPSAEQSELESQGRLKGLASPWHLKIDYGDGTPEQEFKVNQRTFDLAHTYREPGTYTVTVHVEDTSGAVARESFELHLENTQGFTRKQVTDVTTKSYVAIGGSVPWYVAQTVNKRTIAGVLLGGGAFFPFALRRRRRRR